MKRVLWIRLTLVFSLIVVFILSIVPASSIPNIAAFEYLTDKLIHGIIYFFIAILIFLSKFRLSNIKKLSLLFMFGFCCVLIQVTVRRQWNLVILQLNGLIAWTIHFINSL